MRAMKLFISALALLLLVFVGVGFALPGTWEVQREATLASDPDSIFDHLDSIEGWATWAPLAAVEGSRSGPSRGTGATLTWDDPQWGQGRWRLTGAERPRQVSYEVHVEEGALVTRGRITLEREGGGTRLVWSEAGDFGWNPFLAYMALGVERMQGREMEKGLDALREALGEGSSAS